MSRVQPLSPLQGGTTQGLGHLMPDAHHQREIHYDLSTQQLTMQTHEYRETSSREVVGDPLLAERIRRGSLELVAMQIKKMPEIRSGGRTGAWMTDGSNESQPSEIVRTKIDPKDVDKVVRNLNDDVYLYTRKKTGAGVDSQKADLFMKNMGEFCASIGQQVCMIFLLICVLSLVFALMTGSMGH